MKRRVLLSHTQTLGDNTFCICRILVNKHSEFMNDRKSGRFAYIHWQRVWAKATMYL